MTHDIHPKRIWADQDNLTWVEEFPGEAMKDCEAEYILASEHAALIREAEARGMERAAEICEVIRTGIANGPMPEGARFDYEQAIRAAKATP